MPEVEELRHGEPAEVVLENARRKARAGHRLAQTAGPGEGLVVLGVDTDVALDGRLLGKAATEAEARERLEVLSGRTHEVLSGVAVVGVDALSTDSVDKASSGTERAAVATSYVTFRTLDRATTDLYLRSAEWHDRAGAYAIQGLGSILVERVEGDLANVVGLPVGLLLHLAPELVRQRD